MADEHLLPRRFIGILFGPRRHLSREWDRQTFSAGERCRRGEHRSRIAAARKADKTRWAEERRKNRLLERLPRRDPCRATRRLNRGSTKLGFRRQHHAGGDIEGAQRRAITVPAA